MLDIAEDPRRRGARRGSRSARARGGGHACRRERGPAERGSRAGVTEAAEPAADEPARRRADLPPRLRKGPPRGVSRPVAVAITGGIGAGKSEALAAFARHGAATRLERRDRPRADRRRTTRCVRALRESASSARRQLDRGAIAAASSTIRSARVARGAAASARVRGVPTPWLHAGSRAPVGVVEMPLLYETGGEERFDKVVVLTAPDDVRRSRSRVAGEEREARLLPDAEKVAPGRLRLREHGLARRARRVRRVRHGGSDV